MMADRVADDAAKHLSMYRAIGRDDAAGVLELLARPDISALAAANVKRVWLLHAVDRERPAALRALLAADIADGWHDPNNCTLLHHVCSSGSLTCVQVALCFPAAGNVDSRGSDCGSTPLHFACVRSSHLVVELLIKHGANVNAQNDHGETPLHWAVGLYAGPHGEWARQVAICAALARAGADANIRSVNGDTPLHCLLAT